MVVVATLMDGIEPWVVSAFVLERYEIEKRGTCCGLFYNVCFALDSWCGLGMGGGSD